MPRLKWLWDKNLTSLDILLGRNKQTMNSSPVPLLSSTTNQKHIDLSPTLTTQYQLTISQMI